MECILAELSVDSSKNRARRDKKLQKLSFRQISDVICNDKWPQMDVQFNKRETLQIEGCHSKLLYDSLSHLLRSDLNSHLSKNEVLRELFDLGKVLENDEPAKLSKAQKMERVRKHLGFIQYLFLDGPIRRAEEANEHQPFQGKSQEE